MNLSFRKMKKNEIGKIVEIISKAMNQREGRFARKTIRFHFFCKEKKFDDGRFYYVTSLGDKIVGIMGLHHYIWGPDDIVWLGWFAVHPDYQRRGIGTQLMNKTIQEAKQRGYKKIFIETYTGRDFVSARAFYSRFGFKKVGRIKSYTGKEDMVVFGKKL